MLEIVSYYLSSNDTCYFIINKIQFMLQGPCKSDKKSDMNYRRLYSLVVSKQLKNEFE